MRKFLVLFLASIVSLGAGADEAESAGKDEEKKPAPAPTSAAIPTVKMLDADKDGTVSPAEKGAYVNNVVKSRMEETVLEFENLLPEARDETTIPELFKVPEVDQYQQVVAGLEQRAAIFLKIYHQLRRLDRNLDTWISDDEFIYAARLTDIIRPITFAIDRNGNGMIGSLELSLIAPRNIVLPSIKLFLDEKWIIPKEYVVSKSALIIRYDTDKDGKLSIKEQNRLAWAFVQTSRIFDREAAAYREILVLLKSRYEALAAELKGEEE